MITSSQKLLMARAGVPAGPAPSGWTDPDLANASYDGVSLLVSSQDTTPVSLSFKSDGTKMYVLGFQGNAVYEYDLSTAWDVSTASYLQNFSITAQCLGLFLSDDGTKMYVVSNGSDAVFGYDLSTAWNISTASYLQNFNVAAQDITPTSLSFKSDGTKMYVLGLAGADVNEYNLSTAWDISTASYLQNFSISAQDTSPLGLHFSPDGTQMFFSGNINDKVYEYNLSTAWDVSSASFSEDFSVTAQDVTPYDIFFKPDGSKMYMIGLASDSVYQYSTT